MADHRHLFHLVLRLKAIVKASFQMVSSDTLDEALQKIVFATSDALQYLIDNLFILDVIEQHALWLMKQKESYGAKLHKAQETELNFQLHKGQQVYMINSILRSCCYA